MGSRLAAAPLFLPLNPWNLYKNPNRIGETEKDLCKWQNFLKKLGFFNFSLQFVGGYGMMFRHECADMR